MDCREVNDDIFANGPHHIFSGAFGYTSRSRSTRKSCRVFGAHKVGCRGFTRSRCIIRGGEQDAPLLLTQPIPSLFSGMELNSVAIGAQKNVPIPEGLDLDQPININLSNLLRDVELALYKESKQDEFEDYYHRAPTTTLPTHQELTTISRLEGQNDSPTSYQQAGTGEDSYLEPDIVARRRAERAERNKDDPFYIAPSEGKSGTSTPLHNILLSNNRQGVDLDAIPIMELDLGRANLRPASPKRTAPTKARQRIQVAADETLGARGTSTPRLYDSENSVEGVQRKGKGKSLLQVDSCHIGQFSLEGGDDGGREVDYERQQREEADMARAVRDIERLRLEMQRANERFEAAPGVVERQVVVRKKKEKVKPVDPAPAEGDEQNDLDGGADTDTAVVKKKKKKVKKPVDGQEGDVVKPKKKKKVPKIEVEDTGSAA